MDRLRIATRESQLALWQARHVAGRLETCHPGIEVELVPMTTSGDRMLEAPLATVGGKGLFVKELERAILDGHADVAVHSMKDVPVELPPGLHMPVVLGRGDPRDALVSHRHASVDALPRGARVGTSSLRRKCQLAALRPDLELVDLRGNVNTRLGRLDAGEYDAILLAAVGLERLGMGDRVREAIEPERMLPAVGQGVLGVECRLDDPRVERLLAPLHDGDTAAVLGAERALNERLAGGCQVPIAAFALLGPEHLWLRALVASLDGTTLLREEARAPHGEAGALGRTVAEALLARGADRILAAAYAGA